jgi:hypothetical protein
MAVANVKTILIDKNASPPPYGHADGLEQRSFEILDAFQLGNTIWQSAHKTIQVAYWVRFSPSSGFNGENTGCQF